MISRQVIDGLVACSDPMNEAIPLPAPQTNLPLYSVLRRVSPQVLGVPRNLPGASPTHHVVCTAAKDSLWAVGTAWWRAWSPSAWLVPSQRSPFLQLAANCNRLRGSNHNRASISHNPTVAGFPRSFAAVRANNFSRERFARQCWLQSSANSWRRHWPVRRGGGGQR